MVAWKLPLFFVYVVLYYFQLSVVSVEVFQALGTSSNPLIHNIIPQHSCRIHIVFNGLATENLETTQNVAFTLSKLPINTYLRRPKNHLNIFKNKGWACEFFIFYAQGEILLKPGDSLKWWFFTYTHHYLDWREKSVNWHQACREGNGNLYILLLPSKNNFPINSLSEDNNLSRMIRKGNHFAILYLPKSTPDSSVFCVRLLLWMLSAINYFQCQDVKAQPITEKLFQLSEVRIWGLPSSVNFFFDMELYIITIILSKLTGDVPNVPKRNIYVATGNLSINAEHIHPLYPRFVGDGKEFTSQQRIITTSFEGWNYMTCYTETELSFRFYTDPFEWPVWIFVITTMLTFTILTDVFCTWKLKKILILSSLFFYIGAFLEESSLISELLNHSAFRLGVGPWLLLSSILSNVYVSLILRGLNAPPPPTQFKTWQSLFTSNCSNATRNEDWYGVDTI